MIMLFIKEILQLELEIKVFVFFLIDSTRIYNFEVFLM